MRRYALTATLFVLVIALVLAFSSLSVEASCLYKCQGVKLLTATPALVVTPAPPLPMSD